MLAHALLSLLVFKHGFIQIRFGIFELLVFALWVINTIIFNKYYAIFSLQTQFFIDGKRTQWNLNTVEVFHESILKEKFHSVSLP